MLNQLASMVAKTRLHPNMISVLGLIFSGFTAYFIVGSQFLLAGGFIAVSALCDTLDGKVARLNQTTSHFGAFLDSSLDRYSEGIYFSAIAYYFFLQGQPVLAGLALSALLGSFEISYTRARAEGLDLDGKVGFWTRLERMVFLFVALIVGNLALAVIILGFLTHLTALKRMIYVWLQATRRDSARLKFEPKWMYVIQASIYLLALLLIRI
jgi:CDP-diacylglycerol---glycerol-3-phosphate 3-phosphatidyltransferase